MMWNWLMTGLAAGATLVLYDGSPFHPNERVLFEIAEQEGITIFGTSAKFIDAREEDRACGRATPTQLAAIRTMLLDRLAAGAARGSSSSMRRSSRDVHLASISGGTDICGCFVAGNPTAPVYGAARSRRRRSDLPSMCSTTTGQPLADGKGELVCTNAFPSMPIGFWNDPDGAKYHAAYFERFPNVWCHGDFAEWTEHGGMIIHRPLGCDAQSRRRAGSARRKSMPRSSRFRRWWRRWRSGRTATMTCASCCSCG